MHLQTERREIYETTDLQFCKTVELCLEQEQTCWIAQTIRQLP
jgi:hypothetical protein